MRGFRAALVILPLLAAVPAPAAPAGGDQAMEQAMALIDAEQYQAAIGVLRGIDPQTDAQAAEIDRALGRIYLGLGKPAKAADFFDHALATSLDSEAETYLGLAEAKLALGQLSQARSHAETVLKTDPDQVGAHLLLARVDQRLGRQADAVNRLENLAKQRPDSEEVAVVMARYMAQAKSPAAAAERLSLFLRRHPGSALASDALGLLYWETGRKADAVRTRTKAGELYFQGGQTGRAAAIAIWLENVDPQHRYRPPSTPRLAPPPESTAREPEEPPPPAAVPPSVIETRAVPAPPPPAPQSLSQFPQTRAFQTTATPDPLPFRPGTPILFGSGIVLEGGRMVLTNRHVIEGVHDTAIRNGTGHVRRAHVVKVSREDDLALLQLDAPFPEGDSMPISGIAEPSPGRAAIVMGFPLIMVLGDEQPALAEGIVSKMGGLSGDPSSFQMTTKLNKGNSGGPVFDRSGRLIGIAVSKLDTQDLKEHSGIVAEDVNFAIKASHVLRFLGKPAGTKAPAGGEMSLEDLYQSMLPRVVLIASEK